MKKPKIFSEEQQAKESRHDAKMFFLARKDEFDARMKQMPKWFQDRYERLFSDTDATWDAAGFEIFIYDESLKVANVLKTSAAVKEFYELPYPEQLKIVKDLTLCPRHSGQTLEMAIRIAYQYLHETEEKFSEEKTVLQP